MENFFDLATGSLYTKFSYLHQHKSGGEMSHNHQYDNKIPPNHQNDKKIKITPGLIISTIIVGIILVMIILYAMDFFSPTIGNVFTQIDGPLESVYNFKNSIP